MPEVNATPNVDANQTPDPSTQDPQVVETPAQQTPDAGQPDADENTGGQVPITALHEERDKRQATQAKLEAITRQFGITFDADGSPIMPQQQQQQPVESDTHVNSFVAELEKTWEDDPRKAVQMEINAALTWYDNVSAQVDNQIENARSTHKDFNTYAADVSKYIRMLPPAQRSTPGIVENAYWLVKGQKIDTVIASNQQQQQQRIQQAGAASGMGGGTMSGQSSVPNQLTAEQKAVADAMGLTPEAYAAGVKK